MADRPPTQGARLRLLAAALLLLAAGPAAAQLPQLPGLPDVLGKAKDAVPEVEDVTGLADLRRLRVRELLRGNRNVLETDPRGAPIVRREIIAVGLSDASIAAARTAGFTIARSERLEGLDTAIVTLTPPERLSTRRALTRLRAIDPAGAYDFNHIYLESGPVPGPAIPKQGAGGGGGGARLGLIDGGVRASHPALSGARVNARAFAGAAVPTLHGTAVASLLVGRANGFRGAAAGADLFTADVYGGLPTGGSASAIARAFSWLAEERVGVVNVSLVGPPNRAMESIVAGMVRRGHLIVAAVGNDGPAAAPLYPASYPGVVGVTGVTARGRALVEAGRGDQVDFAAPGADMVAADAAAGFAPVRGTSFAAPIVAGLLAQRLAGPSVGGAAQAVQLLASEAQDLGERGRDSTYGAGLVGAGLRTPPQALAAGR